MVQGALCGPSIPIVIPDGVCLPARFPSPGQQQKTYLCSSQVVFNHSLQTALGVGEGMGLAQGKEGDKNSRESNKNAGKPAWMNKEFLTRLKHKKKV